MLIGLGSAMAESSKEELVQLIKRFGAYLTVKISNLLPISLQNLVRTSIPFSSSINFDTFLKFLPDLVLISRQESIALVKIYVVIWCCLLVYSLILIFSLIYAEFGAYLNVNSGLEQRLVIMRFLMTKFDILVCKLLKQGHANAILMGLIKFCIILTNKMKI